MRSHIGRGSFECSLYSRCVLHRRHPGSSRAPPKRWSMERGPSGINEVRKGTRSAFRGTVPRKKPRSVRCKPGGPAPSLSGFERLEDAADGAAIMTDVLGLRTVEGRLILGFRKLLFEDVCAPARNARNGENRRHDVHRNTHHGIHRPAEEIHVGFQAALAHSCKFCEALPFNAREKVVPVSMPRSLAQTKGHLLQHDGTGRCRWFCRPHGPSP